MPPSAPNENEHPMAPVVNQWLSLLEEAEKQKNKRFGQYAKEAYQFYNGAHDWMWNMEYARGGGSASTGGYLDRDSGPGQLPTFRMTVNRVFEAVALFGPVLFHQNPQVTVTPRDRPEVPPEALGFDLNDPLMRSQAQQIYGMEESRRRTRETAVNVKEHYLNWLQVETDKRAHGRRSVTEAIVKGLGLLLTEMRSPPGSRIKYPRSRHISCDQLVKDPDARYEEDVQWIGIWWRHPVNVVERRFNLPEGSLEGHVQSRQSQNTRKGKKQAVNGQKGDSYDLLDYCEIYSKNGFGHRLKSTNKQSTKGKYDFDFLGDFTRIVVAKGVPYPLNLPSESLAEGRESVFMRAQWPIPFWTDDGIGNGWPVSELGFWDDPNDVWPISLIKPAIGEIRFVNWCMSFLADKVAAVSHDYIGVLKAAAQEIQDQIATKKGPYNIIEISEITGRKIDEVISFIQPPNFHSDIWTMVAEVLELIDKRTGLTELIYGLTGRQIRSATEANVRQDNINVRPQDMANRVEDWLGETALKECEAAVWMNDREDVEPVVGPLGAAFWEQYIATQDFDEVVRGYRYRIASGSARRPNKQQKLQALTDFGGVVAQTLREFAVSGHVGPWNAYVEDVADAMDIDPDRYLIELPENDQPSEEEIEAQIETRMKELELQVQRMKDQQELLHAEEKHEQELEHDQEEHEQEMTQLQRRARVEVSGNGSS